METHCVSCSEGTELLCTCIWKKFLFNAVTITTHTLQRQKFMAKI